MPTYDLVIKGGTVIDGLRTPRARTDVLAVALIARRGGRGYEVVPVLLGQPSHG